MKGRSVLDDLEREFDPRFAPEQPFARMVWNARREAAYTDAERNLRLLLMEAQLKEIERLKRERQMAWQDTHPRPWGPVEMFDENAFLMELHKRKKKR